MYKESAQDSVFKVNIILLLMQLDNLGKYSNIFWGNNRNKGDGAAHGPRHWVSTQGARCVSCSTPFTRNESRTPPVDVKLTYLGHGNKVQYALQKRFNKAYV